MDERISCLACGAFDSLNICPKCGLAYCCVKCYRSEGHRKCSEKFYRECIEQELRVRNDAQKSLKTFEQFMNEQPVEDFSMDIEVADSYNHVLDSDDDDGDDSYLDKIKDRCISEYQSAEERELDRQLTLFGIGTDNESLLSSLTDQEKKSFTLFYDNLLAKEEVI
ncbi:Zinc finger HIT domain-containing protein [Dirofilaria immitis]